jgi:micrococcal nuclease
MLRWYIKSLLYLSIILVAFSGFVFADDYHKCIRVVDGDTIVVEVDGKQEKVRLIGVDTPETVHPTKPVEYFGKEAAQFTKLMTEGKKVHLVSTPIFFVPFSPE